MLQAYKALLIPAVIAWTKEGYPDCYATQGSSCFPNLRAPDHHSQLNALFNKWCSDKGTYWLSKHNYGSVYDSVFRPIRYKTHNMLELGVGDETAGSLNAWREYFPSAHFHIIDVDKVRFEDKKMFEWASRQKRRHGCSDDVNVWKDARVSSYFGVDASNASNLRALPLPEKLEIIIDDASHALAHQIASIEALWPKLAPGGFYVVEDLAVGALPWMKGAAGADQQRRVPSNNSAASGCGHECHYAQRPAEHPFIKRLIPALPNKRQVAEALRLAPQLPAFFERVLDENSWFWAITGAHAGGGLDSTLIIQNTHGAALHPEADILLQGSPAEGTSAHTVPTDNDSGSVFEVAAGWTADWSRDLPDWSAGVGARVSKKSRVLVLELLLLAFLAGLIVQWIQARYGNPLLARWRASYKAHEGASL